MAKLSQNIQKLNECTSMKDLEKHVKTIRNQVKNDLKSIENEIQNQKNLRSKLQKIGSEIDQIAAQKFSEILGISATPKRHYRKKKEVEIKPEIKKQATVNRPPARKKLK